MNKRAFTLIELLIIIAIIAILAAFIISNLGDSRSLAQDAVRKNDISNLYKSIVGKNALSESSYPDIVSTIEPGKTNSNLQSFIDQFLKTTPYDPNPTKAYLYKGNGKDFSIAAILDDGSCFIKSTGLNLFGSDTICSTYNEGGIGLVQNFMFLHGSTYLDLIWSIPTSLSSLPTSNVSSAIICLDSASELDPNSLPSDEYLFTHGTIITLVNNAVNEYRITLDNPDYYYYCKTYSYDNTVITNPGVPGSSPNTSTGGFSSGSSSSSNYSSSSPSTYTPGASSNPPSIGGSTTTGGSTSPSFNLEPIRNPDGTGSITLSWIPGYLSTHTLIRRDYNTPPETRTDGTSIYYERNDKDNQDITSIHYHTDTGLSEDYIYCYSAWAYDERTNTYSNGFVLACGGVPPSNPTNLTMTSTTNSFNLNWTKGSSTNTVIRRSINTPPQNQEQGTLVYNSTSSSFTDTDITLTKNTTYCYSIWSYNPTTASLSTEYLSSCGTLSNMATPTNLSFPTVAYNSIILNWTPGTGSTNTLIVRKQGSIPTSRTDGTTIYEDNGNAFIDTGLTDNTEYCYALYATDGTEYTEALTGCQSTSQFTALMMYMEGEDNGTVFTDETGKVVEVYGNTKTVTAVKKFGNSSMFLDGTGDYLKLPSSSDFNFGASDFTIDFWFKTRTTYNSTGYYIFNLGGQIAMSLNNWYTTSARAATLSSAGGVYNYGGSLGAYTDTNWHHYALTRSSGTCRSFMDGVAVGSSFSCSSDIDASSSNKYIGVWGEANPYISDFDGYIDNFRITKGIAYWTTNFTPPADSACGTASKDYDGAATSFGTDTFCASGTVSGIPSFPEFGETVSWACEGMYGNEPLICYASKGLCPSGATCKTVDGDTVAEWKTVGSYTWVVPAEISQVEVLVVGGGGGGGDYYYGGGGGAGGVVYHSNKSVSGNISITVGAGGLVKANGGNSVFGDIVAIGGGAGGDYNGRTKGVDGGSGGGTAMSANVARPWYGISTQTNSGGGVGYGHNGGDIDPNDAVGGAGGGGAGSSGGSNLVKSLDGQRGGDGIMFNITGENVVYAAGGGGGAYYTGALGGDGGSGGIGGRGSSGSIFATAGTPNTGSGGGGGWHGGVNSNSKGKGGGSGIVIVRYQLP
ncbi:hypothetical protein MNSC_05600 [Minisyncoccus archaeophilus]|uniref:glycine-rich domain-containing protein n=1 Tax=Minisyncoccus archaeiphilus TaxID=3238481 RepID=UPI00399D5369